MRTRRLLALVVGCLLIIPSLGMLLGGGALALGHAFARDGDGYYNVTLDRASTDTVAITAEDLAFAAEPGSPDWLVDALDADVRLRVTDAGNSGGMFIGIGSEADVAAYLAGVAHVEVTELDGLTPELRSFPGGSDIAPPSDQDFWAASAVGVGTQELTWEATAGRWSVVLMNADASPDVSADIRVGIKSDAVLTLALVLLGAGVVLTALSIALIATGATGGRKRLGDGDEEAVPWAGEPDSESTLPTVEHPVLIEARLDPQLSRWMWLVKWLLAIPHVIVLFFLTIAFVVLTVVAWFAIVFTGRYPRGIFDFNVGVMRWAWRVSFYAASGGIGSDRYPAFSLHPEPDDLVRLDVAYPERLSRGLAFVKLLLAIPHLVIVALLAGSSVQWFGADGDRTGVDLTGGAGLLGVLVLIAGVALLFRGRYPQSMFDLIIGINRWIYRVVAYVALMTDEYPPFRLDQGGTEPVPASEQPAREPSPAPSELPPPVPH